MRNRNRIRHLRQRTALDAVLADLRETSPDLILHGEICHTVAPVLRR